MNDKPISQLYVSNSTYGRYAFGSPDGPEISSGQPLALELAGQWIEGSVEHAREIYANRGLQTLFDAVEGRTLEGYYFMARGGGICGLCVGMRVKVL